MARHIIGSELEDTAIVKDKKINKKKIWLTIIIGFVLSILLLLGYWIYSDLKEEELLKQEIETYMELDFINDEFSVEIKTSGDYAKVEMAIKTYFKDFSDIVKEISAIESDDDFLNILTIDNFKEDGPSFLNTRKKINDVRNKFQNNIDKFVSMCSEEYIISMITKYEGIDDYYIDLYKELMYTKDDLGDIEDTKNEILELKNEFVVFLDDCENIIMFLKNNSGKWIIEGNSIVFDRNELLEEYNSLTSKLLGNDEV